VTLPCPGRQAVKRLVVAHRLQAGLARRVWPDQEHVRASRVTQHRYAIAVTSP